MAKYPPKAVRHEGKNRLSPDRMIDWHCHLLSNIDDGPRSMEESVEMAAAIQKAGFTTVYCTPHMIKGVFDADNEIVVKSVSELQKRLIREKIDLTLIAGREYYLDEYLFTYLKKPLTLGDTSFIMIEIPDHMPIDHIKETCFQIKCRGYNPMIAHPERCKLFAAPEKQKRTVFSRLAFGNGGLPRNENSLLSYLCDISSAFQCNLGSLAGRYGREVHARAEGLQKLGIYTFYGTDAHSLQGIESIEEELLLSREYQKQSRKLSHTGERAPSVE